MKFVIRLILLIASNFFLLDTHAEETPLDKDVEIDNDLPTSESNSPAERLEGIPNFIKQGLKQVEAKNLDTLPTDNQTKQLWFDAQRKLQQGEYAQSELPLKQVMMQDPTNLEVWQQLGWVYWLTGRKNEAKELWEDFVMIAPNEPLGYTLLAEVAVEDVNFKKALELFERSLELDPSQFEIRVKRAQMLLWLNKPQEALREYQQLSEEKPTRMDISVNLAWSLYVDERYEETLVQWDKILQQDPGNPNFLLARANVRMLLGMIEGAESDALKALELKPDELAAVQILSGLSMRANRPLQTLERMEVILEKMTTRRTRRQVAENISVYMFQVRQRQPEVFSQAEVVEAGKVAWDIDPLHGPTTLFYGEALLLAGLYDQAEEVFTYALEELNPNLVRAREGLFEVYMANKDFEEAEKQLRDNLRAFNEQDPFRHLSWARLYFDKGDFTQALQSLKQLEYEGARGSVFSLLYHGISPSEFSDMPSTRQLREQILALKRDGFSFITVSDLPDYFDSLQAPPLIEDDQPWLNKLAESVKYAWSGERTLGEPSLKDFSPDKVALISFDDGLRNSFRYGTLVAQETNVPMTMFVGVGDVLDKNQRYVASFEEIQEWNATGVWDIQSHLWDAGQLAPLDEEGERLGLRLANRIWKPEFNRIETLREYQKRLKREFSGSKRVLARELGVPESGIHSVAYPYGEIGQENPTNITLFDVGNVIINQAEISYSQGFIQGTYGYSMKGANPLMYRRHEPARHDTGNDVLLEAYLQHPVFVARRVRAEMAALSGELYMAQENIELLRRDGYPEEELTKIIQFVNEQLGSLFPLPEEDRQEPGTSEVERVNNDLLNDPYIGVDGQSTQANVVIDQNEFGVFAGVNIGRRFNLQVRGASGQIDQTLTTNRVVEVEETTTTSSIIEVVEIQDGETTDFQEFRTTTNTSLIQSNVVDRIEFSGEFSRLEAELGYVHEGGSYTLFKIGQYSLETEGNDEVEEEAVSDSVLTYGVEHQWRPIPSIDLSAFYFHGAVPSARELLTYDQFAVRPLWRIRDGWHLEALGTLSYYEDQNSLLHMKLENFWRFSRESPFWLGFHSSIFTADVESDLYWTPYLDQRHYFILRVRQAYLDYFATLNLNIGWNRELARNSEIAEFQNAQAQGEEFGFSPGPGPDEDWSSLIGFSATLNRTWESGWSIESQFIVNNTREYTEHSILARILYTF